MSTMNTMSTSDPVFCRQKDSGVEDEFCDPNNPKVVQFQDVSAAAYKLKGGVQLTPCTRSRMSQLFGIDLYFKKEFLQFTGSFKERGARYTLLMLPQEDRKRGVIAASTGNHALSLSYHGSLLDIPITVIMPTIAPLMKDKRKSGVIAASAGNHAMSLAYHGSLLDIPVTVVMPTIAPLMKIQTCREYHANIVIQGGDIIESRAHALKLAKEKNLMYINGYDHPDIIAGQGTMGLEIVEQVPDLDACLIPVGGGGLIAGSALAIKSLKPNVLIYGVESERCASFAESMKVGKPKWTKAESSIADGLAVPTVGCNALVTATPYIDKMLTVKEESIALAILRLIELEKAVVEGAGASALAAVVEGLVPELKGKKVVIALCGGNIDTTVLGRVLERGLAADHRLIRFSVIVSDGPGGVAELTKIIASIGISIKDIFQERPWVKSDIFSVKVKCVVETRNQSHATELRNLIKQRYGTIGWETSYIEDL